MVELVFIWFSELLVAAHMLCGPFSTKLQDSVGWIMIQSNHHDVVSYTGIK